MYKSIIMTSMALLVSWQAHAGILWAGGEDIDFPNGSAPCVFTGGYYRSSFAREALYSCTGGNFSSSAPFPGGAITSGWLSAQLNENTSPSGMPLVGLSKAGSTGSVWISTSSGNPNKVALWTYNGSWTEVAVESGTSISSGPMVKLDMQVISYGASATINIYVNSASTPNVTYTGNLAVGTATSLDSVIFYGNNGTLFSEFIVSTTDTRNLSLATLAPASAGDTNSWTGAYTNINGTSVNQTSVVSDATTGHNFECHVSALPSGSFSVAAVVLAAQATKYSTGVASIALGVKTNSTVSVPPAVTQTAAWATMNTIYNTNPVTTVNWTTTDANALQINLQTAP